MALIISYWPPLLTSTQGFDYNGRAASLYTFLKDFAEKYPRFALFIATLLFVYFFINQVDLTIAHIFESLIRIIYPTSHYIAVTNEQFFARLSRMATRSDEVMEACPKGIAGLLPTFKQIVGAPAPERWGPLLEEVPQCLFDVVADLKFLTRKMMLEMGKKVVFGSLKVDVCGHCRSNGQQLPTFDAVYAPPDAEHNPFGMYIGFRDASCIRTFVNPEGTTANVRLGNLLLILGEWVLEPRVGAFHRVNRM
ncbi:hypothetical protein Y032_0399g747 [Ancylostoma ceylanicum]|uniref:Uncharacterized protein n=1 Tax=Ancylostoma ceylanicum TaxID=53326 RepID=A0A016RS64_9BILA|nr:hypothetical protein Y032_0399g747 [Ancylostoma ceylanicum]